MGASGGGAGTRAAGIAYSHASRFTASPNRFGSKRSHHGGGGIYRTAGEANCVEREKFAGLSRPGRRCAGQPGKSFRKVGGRIGRSASIDQGSERRRAARAVYLKPWINRRSGGQTDPRPRWRRTG